MFRCAFSVVATALSIAAAAPALQERAVERSLRLGGAPMELLAGQGSLWVLTCDRGCTGEARRSNGRIIRIDPRSGRVVASATLARPGTIAVGASGLYATDFWRDTIRLIDFHNLRLVGTLNLKLPFRFTQRDNAFLPEAAGVGQGVVWVVSDRGALVRTDPQLRRAIASLRLPSDAFGDAVGGMAVGSGGVWLAETLAGVYRIDQQTNRISAKIRIPSRSGGFDAEQIFPMIGQVIVIGEKTSGNVLTQQNALGRIDANHNRVEGVMPLPSGHLVATFAQGSLWVAQYGGSTIDRIDPRTGKVLARLRAHAGVALAVADGHLWTASRDGTIRELR